MVNNSHNQTLRIFDYDNLVDYTYLKQIFTKANKDFLLKDYDLLESDVAETALCGALKSRMEKFLDKDKIYDYYVDLEYNRNNGNIKTIIDEELAIIKIKCDFILHSRGHNPKQDNLLALEMKKSYRSQEEKDTDRKRLIALTKSTYDNDVWSYDGKTFPEHVCRYIIGIYYEIDWENKKIIIEYYKGGQLAESKIIRLPLTPTKHFVRL